MSDLPEEISKASSFDEFRKLVAGQPDFLSRIKYMRGVELSPITIGAFESYIEPFCVEKDRYIELAGKALHDDKKNMDVVMKEMKQWMSPGSFAHFESGVAAMFDHSRQIFFHYDQKSRLLAVADEAYSVALDNFFKGKNMATDDTAMINERLKTVKKALDEIDGLMKRYEKKEK